jgi:hypothetical protein
MANPFDLTKRAGGGAFVPPPARTWTPEEQAAKLAGFMAVPREHWPSIRKGTHMRYFTHADGFRPGGFVTDNPFEAPVPGEAARTSIRLQNGFNPHARSYLQWAAAYADIEHVYIRADAPVLVLADQLRTVVDKLNANVMALEKRLRAVERRDPARN